MKIERIIMNELVAHYGYKFEANTVGEAQAEKLVRIVYEIINKHDLQQPVINCKKQNDWRLITDELPKNKQEVAVFFKNERGEYCTYCYWSGSEFVDLNEDTGEESPYLPDNIITHWQPLPEPPQ